MQEELFVRKIAQTDNQTFTIEWNDGISQLYFLPTLQEACPCAGCHELKQQGKEQVNLLVRAKKLYSVGRYALRVLFTSGCSSGIYDYSLLRRIGTRKE